MHIIADGGKIKAFSQSPKGQDKAKLAVFDNPKPLRLLSRLLTVANVLDNDIVLDFFSGSSTTAHAIIAMNAQDDSNRQFIMVQLPELCSEKSEAYKAGYKTICDIGTDRIRRAGEQIKQQHVNDLLTRETPLDTGFRVFELDDSNFPIWNDSSIAPNATEQLLMRFEHRLKGIHPERSHKDVIFEILLKYGWPLDLKIFDLPINGKKFYSIGEKENDVLIIIAIDSLFEPEDAEKMAKLLPVKVIAVENAFKNDNDLANCSYIFQENEINFERI